MLPLPTPPSLLLGLLKKYWLHLIVLFLILWSAKGIHDDGIAQGYAQRDREALQEQVAMRDVRDKLLADVRAKEAAQRERADAAELEASLSRMMAEENYNNWQEAKKNVPLTIAPTGCPAAGAPQFTVGFVGLFNLAVKEGGLPAGAGVPEIQSAADPDGRLAGAGIAAPAYVTADDILDAVGNNSKLLRTCLKDRKELKQLLEPLYEQGILLR